MACRVYHRCMQMVRSSSQPLVTEGLLLRMASSLQAEARAKAVEVVAEGQRAEGQRAEVLVVVVLQQGVVATESANLMLLQKLRSGPNHDMGGRKSPRTTPAPSMTEAGL